MNLDSFISILDSRGINYGQVGTSVCLDCPNCGRQRKVYLQDYNDMVLGKCFSISCDERYNSFKYLLKYGIKYEEVLALHGEDPLIKIKMTDPAFFLNLLGQVSKKEEKKVINTDPVDLMKFMRIEDWPDHPAAAYAIKRGAVPEFYDRIWINPVNNSVVFIVRDYGKIIGYQQRFISAKNAKDKTRTSVGFEKSLSILEFPKIGKDLVICEGPFTALSAWHFGYHGVCTFGSSVSDYQLNEIYELSKDGKRVGIAFDNDKAGKSGALLIYDYLNKKGIGVFKVDFDNKYNDLNDVWLDNAQVSEKGPEEFKVSSLPELKMF